MDKGVIENADAVLRSLLQTQPNLLAPIGAHRAAAEEAAEFCVAFIEKYAELYEALLKK